MALSVALQAASAAELAMSRLLCLALLLLFVVSHAMAATEDGPPPHRRVALGVGVSHYAHAPALPNSASDAADMSEALRPLGFDVETVLDPDRAALEAALRRYGDRVVGAEASLFHYSGHALEAGGVNWILPSSA